MSEIKSAEQAVEVLKAAGGGMADSWEDVADEHEGFKKEAFALERAEEIRSALAFLDGLHIYASRFKPGDEVYIVSRSWDEDYNEPTSEWWAPTVPANIQRIVFGQINRSHESRISIDAGDDVVRSWTESDCFPTREEARAECARRNSSSNPKEKV